MPPVDLSHEPVALLAGSYELSELDKAYSHVDGLKSDDGRTAARGKIASDLETTRDTSAAAETAVPEGHVLKEIEDAQGMKVIAPVADPKLKPDEPVEAQGDTHSAPPETGKAPAKS